MGSMPQNQVDNLKLFIDVLEEKVRWVGDHTFMRYPTADWETDGYRTLTWSRYADAVNKVAYWLDKQLGPSQNNDTVAYLGPADPRYMLILPAAVKTRRKLLLPDGRVTEEGFTGLLESTKCSTWIQPEDDFSTPPKAADGLKRIALPRLEWCLDSQGYRPYPYNKTFEEAKWEEILIIHTSGTTGIPKPIYLTNGFFAAIASPPLIAKIHWPRPLLYEIYASQPTLSACPPQWLGGLFAYLFSPYFFDASSIMPPADVVGMPPAIFKKIMSMNKVDGITCPPHCVHELYADPESQRILKSLNYITYLGANLDREIGDDLCQHTRIACVIGSTENGSQWEFQPADRKLWYTHGYVPELGFRMVPVPDSDDLHELVLDRAEDGEPTFAQSAFWNLRYNGVNHIETSELYKPVKDADGQIRWAFAARKDDLTKLSYLAKFHAGDIEERVRKHPDVSEVVVGGEGRPAPYILIETKPGVLNSKSADKFLDELYNDVVKKTNEADIDEISIPRETVLVAEKRFRRTAKHTIPRKAVETDHAKEIEEAYAKLEGKS